MSRKQHHCVECGKPIFDTNMRGMCQACYKYFQGGGLVYALPKYGEVQLDPDGKPICHICGRSYRKLGAHVMNSHHILAHDYKVKFGLDRIKGLCSKDYREWMRDKVMEHADVIITRNLILGGMATRYQPNHKGRTADKMSEQTRRRVAKLGASSGATNLKSTPNHKKSLSL